MNINLLNSPPRSHSLTCSGYELASALKEIEANGGRVESVDIVGVSGYKLNYFNGGVAKHGNRTDSSANTGSSPVASTRTPKYIKSVPEVIGVGLNAEQQPLQSNPRDYSKGTKLALEAIDLLQDSLDRLERLRLKAIESGRVRPIRVARMPHNSE